VVVAADAVERIENCCCCDDIACSWMQLLEATTVM
jgi:hypothetical protein